MYPNCFTKTRIIEIGGLDKYQLIEKMRENGILINAFGEKILMDINFTTSDIKIALETVELTVGDLGFLKGDTLRNIFKRANQLGLKLCPLEIAPYLRLDHLDQIGNEDFQKNQAPKGSITIASKIIKDEQNFPKGFYIRRIKDELWLRGYIASDDYIWNLDDHFIFIK